MRIITAKTNNLFVVLAIIFAISIFSYHTIEQPIRRQKKVFVPIIIPYFITLALLLFYSFGYHSKSEDVSAFAPTYWYGGQYDLTPNKGPDKITKGREGVITLPSFQDNNAYQRGGIIKQYGKATTDIVVLGDSHAMMWGKVIDGICKQLKLTVSFNAANATPAFFKIPVTMQQPKCKYFTLQEKVLYDQNRLQYLMQWKPKIVLISMRWSNLKDVSDTDDLLSLLHKIGTKVILVEDPPELFFIDKSVPSYLAYLGVKPISYKNQYVSSSGSTDFAKGELALKQIAAKYNCSIIKIQDLFLKHNAPDSTLVLAGDKVLYLDDDHLCQSGAELAKPRFEKAIKEAFVSQGRLTQP